MRGKLDNSYKSRDQKNKTRKNEAKPIPMSTVVRLQWHPDFATNGLPEEKPIPVVTKVSANQIADSSMTKQKLR